VWNSFVEALSDSTGRLIGVGIALITLLMVVYWARRAAARTIADNSVRYHTRKVISGVGVALGLLIIAVSFSESLSGLPLVLGVSVAGIALALQDLIASVAGWLVIASGRVFKPGDRVELGGVRGDVIDVGVLRTTLMEMGQWVNGDLYCGRIVRVANSAVFKQPLYNYSAHFPFVWDEIVVPIRYGSDRALARQLLLDAVTEVTGDYATQARATWKQLVQRFLIEDAEVAPMVSLAITDNWLQYTVRYVCDVKRRRTTRDQISERILAAIDASNGRVTIASATIELVPPPEVTRKAA
jgi:small-conductance mechanosensitive channel